MIVHHYEKLTKCVNRKIKSHKKLSSMFSVPAVMLFSPKNCINRHLLKSPITKLDIAGPQWISKMGPNGQMSLSLFVCWKLHNSFIYSLQLCKYNLNGIFLGMAEKLQTLFWQTICFFNWDSVHARLNILYKAWSYKNKKHKNIKIIQEISLEKTYRF